MSWRVEVLTVVASASCFWRLIGDFTSLSPLILVKRPLAVRTTMHGVSASSALTEAALAIEIGLTSSTSEMRVVRRSSPYLSATSANSALTTARKFDSLAKIRSSSAISATSVACSVSSSSFENLVNLRRRSSRMYSAWSSLRSKTSRSLRRASSTSSLLRMI